MFRKKVAFKWIKNKQKAKHWDQVIYELLWSVQNPKEFYHEQCHSLGKVWLEDNLLFMVWENLKFPWDRVIERIQSRTILLQRKGHTNQRPLSFECRSLIVEGYYIDAICSEGSIEILWWLRKCSMKLDDQTEPAVYFRKEASGKWPHCHL